MPKSTWREFRQTQHSRNVLPSNSYHIERLWHNVAYPSQLLEIGAHAVLNERFLSLLDRDRSPGRSYLECPMAQGCPPRRRALRVGDS
jgi:hypothetical protein